MSAPEPNRPKTVIYPYVDDAGQIAFEAVRIVYSDRAECLQYRRPSGEPDGSWLWSLEPGEFMRLAPGKNWFPFDAAKFEQCPATRERKFFDTAAPIIPYQLQELRKAVTDSCVIFICKDEDEADFLRSKGLCATCCARGAKSWGTEHARFLQGANVVLTHAKVLAESLASIVRRMRILENSVILDLRTSGDTKKFLACIAAAPKCPELRLLPGGKDANDTPYAQSINFLQKLRPDGPWLLIAIDPDSRAIAAETVRSLEAAEAFVRKWDGKRNLYYSVNPTWTMLDKKAAKTDIAAIEYMLGDLDPADGETSEAAKARYLKALEHFDPKPTALIDSGNGLQPLWRLQEHIALGELEAGKFTRADQDTIADIEVRIAAIMLRLDAKPGTQNIDRILRLPGTINLPNEKKRKEGRTRCPTKLLWFDDTSYPLDAFPSNATQGATESTDLPFEDLGEGLGKPRDESPSGYGYRFMQDCHAKGMSYDEARTAILADKTTAGEWARRSDIDERQLERAWKHSEPKQKPGAPAQPTGRATILIKKGEVARIVDEAETALLAVADMAPIMVRAGMLVQPITDLLPASHGRMTEVALLRPLTAANLVYLLNKHAATFEQYNWRSKKWLAVDPPSAIATQLLEKGRWRFPKVAGVITTPTLRPDGTILDHPGYDPATQLWYKPDSQLVLPRLLESPTREQAEQALKLLTDLLVGFPFESDVYRSVALSAILTAVLRGAFDVVPMNLLSAPDFGSGKSYLADLISIIARGQVCPVITNVKSVEEMEKRLGALVLEGVQMVSLDNCSDDIGGDLLCQIAERRLIHIRILGKSEMPECEWRGVLFATGTNITYLADMARRGLISTLNPEVERPELRTFSFDPIEQVLANRGSYIAAAFTIARAYLTAGSPKVCGPLGSYEPWSRMVRSPLIWLGQEDPVKSMDEAREEDPVRRAERSLITIWRDYLGPNSSYTAADLIKKATEQKSVEVAENIHESDWAYPQLRELLLQQAGTPRGDIEAKKVGNWLMSIRGRIHVGHCIERVKESKSWGNTYNLRKL
jgi:putative DNA primase/helicase